MPPQIQPTTQNLPPQTIKLLNNINSTLQNTYNVVNGILTNLNNIANVVSSLQPQVNTVQKTQKSLLQLYKELAKGLIPINFRKEIKQAIDKSSIPDFMEDYIEDLKDWFKNSYTIHQFPKLISTGFSKVISFMKSILSRKTPAQQMLNLQKSIQNTIGNVTSSKIKPIKTATQNLQKSVQNIGNVTSSKIKPIKTATQNLHAGLTNATRKIQMSTAKSSLAVTKSVANTSKTLSRAVSSVGVKSSLAITKSMANTSRVLSRAVSTVGVKTGFSIAKMGKGIYQTVGKVARGVGGAIGILIELVLDLLYPVLLWIKTMLGTIIKSSAGFIKMIGAIFSIVTTIYNFLSFVILGLIGALMINVLKLFSNIGKFFDNLWTRIKEFFKKLEDKIIGFSKNAWKGIKNLFKKNDDTNKNITKTSNETKNAIKKTEYKVTGEIKSSTKKQQKSKIQKTEEVKKTVVKPKTTAKAIVKEEKVKAPPSITPPATVPKVEVSKELKPLVDTMIGQFSITNGKLDSISTKIQEMGTVITNINGALLIDKQKSTVRNYQ